MSADLGGVLNNESRFNRREVHLLPEIADDRRVGTERAI
jgi:hypothetical protein